MSFIQDLKVGEYAEKEFENFIQACGYSSGRNTSQTVTEKRFYDIWAQLAPPKKARKKTPRPVYTFEVKKDRRAIETGNVFLEHESLENSRADYIVYQLEDGFYIQDRARVLTFLYLPQFTKKSGSTYSEGTLIPLDTFKQIFRNAQEVFA